MTSSSNCAANPCFSRSPYTGKERDAESGNDYFGARYYASNMGRFMSPDPSQLAFANPTNPQSFNLYAYGQNNPLVNVDPTGLSCITLDGGTIADDGDGNGCEAAGVLPSSNPNGDPNQFDPQKTQNVPVNADGSCDMSDPMCQAKYRDLMTQQIPSKTKLTLQCANQIAPSIGNSVVHSDSWFAQNYLGNDVCTLVGVFSGPDSKGSLVSAAFSNALDNTGAPTSLVGMATGLAGSQPVVSGTKVAVRTTSNGSAYGADFVQPFAQTGLGKIAFRALAVAGLAKLGFDVVSYGVASYYCYEAQ